MYFSIVLLNLTTSGTNQVVLKEGELPSNISVTVSITGATYEKIPVILIPLSYAEFESKYSSNALDQLFPRRPLQSAEKGLTPVEKL